MNILIAPDKFKEACTAHEAAEAIAAGVREALPDAELTLCPLADGGDGTGPVLAETLNAEPRKTQVIAPHGAEIEATWWWQSQRKLAILEMAEASGLRLVPPEKRNPLHLTSYGAGQLIQAAIEAGACEIWLGCGGSATVDGGVALMQALGWQLLSAHGDALPAPLSPSEFHNIHQLVAPAHIPNTPITILCDVNNPILGPNGATAVFGPQKGADPAAVKILAAALTHWVQLLKQTTALPVEQFVSGGAAGGIPATLKALLRAEPTLGIRHVFKAARIEQLLTECDLCLTGEGQLDDQSASGKVIGELAAAAKNKAIAFVGSTIGEVSKLTQQLNLRDIVVITPPDTPLPEALANTQQNLTNAASDYFANEQP